MAEEKPAPKNVTDSDAAGRIAGLLVAMLLIGALASALLSYFEALRSGVSGDLWTRMVDYFLDHIWPIWKIIAAIISALSIWGIIRNMWKLQAINVEDNKIYNPVPVVSASEKKVVEQKNDRWEKILKYANSDSVSDWRMAIIEADVMLEELLRATGYHGESIGEMLKSVEKGDFTTLDEAWEAHKVRNAVAHSGGDFQLNERETKRTIALFEKVFREFGVI